MNDNEYVRLREDEVLKNSEHFRLQTTIWSNEISDHERICSLLNFWKTSIFRFSRSLSAVSFLRNWTSMSAISWRNWTYSADRNFSCLIMTAVEMIDKRFEIISIELRTRDQLDWCALQLRKMFSVLSIFVFQSNDLNRPICCLLRDWYRKHSELTLTMMEKWEG